MIPTNNGSTILDREEAINNGGITVAVNSIQRTLYVERLHVDPRYPADRIIPYDFDNLYPNKIKNIAMRSGTTMSSIGTLSSFISGEGFQGMDIVVNREGQTMWDILRHISFSKSMFAGQALHFNYNIFGQIIEINPINFEFVRWHKDLQRFVVNPDWYRRFRRSSDEEIYNPFDPRNVLNEIEQCKGIEKYSGQLYYWIPSLDDYYTVCTWDSVLDDAQFEAEAKLYSLSSIQNDYSLSGIIAYPKALENEKEIQEVKKDFQKDKGAANAGGFRVVPMMNIDGAGKWPWFTPISRNDIDDLHKGQKEDAKFNIYAAFRQPPILNGVATSGMFNQESFADAFEYYNAATETERKEVEKELNKIIQSSIWVNTLPGIKIQPKKFVGRQKTISTPGSQPAAKEETPQ